MSNFMNIQSMTAELFHADVETDRHEEVKTGFLQFCYRVSK
jgi:hypothetical protein